MAKVTGAAGHRVVSPAATVTKSAPGPVDTPAQQLSHAPVTCPAAQVCELCQGRTLE